MKLDGPKSHGNVFEDAGETLLPPYEFADTWLLT